MVRSTFSLEDHGKAVLLDINLVLLSAIRLENGTCFITLSMDLKYFNDVELVLFTWPVSSLFNFQNVYKKLKGVLVNTEPGSSVIILARKHNFLSPQDRYIGDNMNFHVFQVEWLKDRVNNWKVNLSIKTLFVLTGHPRSLGIKQETVFFSKVIQYGG